MKYSGKAVVWRLVTALYSHVPAASALGSGCRGANWQCKNAVSFFYELGTHVTYRTKQ